MGEEGEFAPVAFAVNDDTVIVGGNISFNGGAASRHIYAETWTRDIGGGISAGSWRIQSSIVAIEKADVAAIESQAAVPRTPALPESGAHEPSAQEATRKNRKKEIEEELKKESKAEVQAEVEHQREQEASPAHFEDARHSGESTGGASKSGTAKSDIQEAITKDQDSTSTPIRSAILWVVAVLAGLFLT